MQFVYIYKENIKQNLVQYHMKKIIFVFCLVSTFCWCQKPKETFTAKEKAENTQYISIDSLKSLYDKNSYALKEKVSHKFASKIIYPFLNVLRNQKEIRQIRNEDLNDLIRLEALTMTELMIYVHVPKNAVDSVLYYQKQIATLTKEKKIIAKSYGKIAHAYASNNRMIKAINNYEKALIIHRLRKNKTSLIGPLVNTIDFLQNLEHFEYANHYLLELSQIIKALPKGLKYENYMQLLKVVEASILNSKRDFKKGLQILNKVDTTKINREVLKDKYNSLLFKTYIGLKNFNMAEILLDKQYGATENNFDITNIIYYQHKLSFALEANNVQKADTYFKKINEIIVENEHYENSTYFMVLSRYYASIKKFEKAFTFLQKSSLLKDTNDRKVAQIKLALDNYFIKYNKELLAMKTLADSKDELINKNRSIYINLTLLILFISVIIIIIIIAIFSVARTFRKREHYKTKIKILGEKTILDSKQKFLENMSHEIRTPITSIMGYLTLLQEQTLNFEKRKKYTNRAFANTQKMIAALNSFLTLLKAEEGKLTINKKTTISFNTFMDKVVSPYLADFEIKNIRFYYKSNTKDNLNINYDLESLKVILNNLISNAIKYSSANTEIYLNVHFTEEGLNITIKDEGFGIPEEEKEMIFTRFYQTKQNESIGGFGIGLSLVAELINKLNGRIHVESKINVGSIFYVHLPYLLDNFTLHTNSLEKEFKLISIEECTQESKKEDFEYPKVLIVDDNIEMIAYLKEIFIDTLACTFAFNGLEALEKIKEQKFDLIISDLRMPLLSGTKFKEALNKIDSQKDIPFIMITAVFYNKLEGLKDTLNLNEYLEKPFSKDEILSRVQYTLERKINRNKIVALESTNCIEVDFDSSSAVLVEKIKETILSNLTNPEFNVTMLSNLCGYEQKKLNQILKSKIGLSIVNIILEVRLLKAYEYIIKNRFPTLNEVMYAVGINSRSYFSKKFEERFGLKVGELRKKNLSV